MTKGIEFRWQTKVRWSLYEGRISRKIWTFCSETLQWSFILYFLLLIAIYKWKIQKRECSVCNLGIPQRYNFLLKHILSSINHCRQRKRHDAELNQDTKEHLKTEFHRKWQNLQNNTIQYMIIWFLYKRIITNKCR